jgi:hypothetical protein
MSPRTKVVIIVCLSIIGGLVATAAVPEFISWIPYDYSVYVEGARFERQGADPYSQLEYWYPLPIVAFTTMLWSFLPDRFAWAFAFIPLGLLHLRFGKRAILWWFFYPLLINVAYAQAEGWLVLPLFWILEDAPRKGIVGILAVTFKPAYGLLLVPYRLYEWFTSRRWSRLIWLVGIGSVMLATAFLIDLAWLGHWFNAILRRGDNLTLIERNMTVWSFVFRGGLWYIPFALIIFALVLISIPMLRCRQTRAATLLCLSLMIFPGGLNPVSSMMVIPLAHSMTEILVLVVTSWLVAGLEILIGGFGGLYLLIVFVALWICWRREAEPLSTLVRFRPNLQP